MSDVAPDATAFEHRNAKYWLLIIGTWKSVEEREGVVNWVREVHQAMKPFASGTYAPVIGGGTEEDPTGLAFNSNMQRLVELKQKFDPQNLFRNNRNIDPTTKV